MAGPQVAFREAWPEDCERLEAIRRAAFAPIFASFRALAGPEVAAVALTDEEEGQRRHLDELLAGGEGRQVYVALLDGTVAGFVAVILDETKGLGEIGLNAVDPALAGRGIGSAMYAFALERMHEAGMKAAYVGTGAEASHAAARAAYAKAGFDRAIPAVHLYRSL